MTDNLPNLGACCVCGRSSSAVRNIVLLHQRAPIPGHGWGCGICGLPADGAVAVVCDACLASGNPIRFVVVGYPYQNTRMPIHDLAFAPFDHDPRKHWTPGPNPPD